MDVEDLRKRLTKQLESLDDEEFPPQSFKVWWVPNEVKENLGDAVISIDWNAWSWGHCTSETCAHNSHDPYSEGHVVHVNAAPIGETTEGVALFRTRDGVVFGYEYHVNQSSIHYAPLATFVWDLEEII